MIPKEKLRKRKRILQTISSTKTISFSFPGISDYQCCKSETRAGSVHLMITKGSCCCICNAVPLTSCSCLGGRASAFTCHRKVLAFLYKPCTVLFLTRSFISSYAALFPRHHSALIAFYCRVHLACPFMLRGPQSKSCPFTSFCLYPLFFTTWGEWIARNGAACHL